MTGHDFIARRRLSDRANRTLADVGERCDRVPVSSLAWLADSGAIARVAPPVGHAVQTSALRAGGGVEE